MAKDKTAPSAPEPEPLELSTPKELPPNAPQGDFHITILETFTRTATYIVPVTRDAVVEDLALTDDQVAHWGSHVHAYVPGHWNELKPLSTLDGTPTETLTKTDFLLTEWRGPMTANAKTEPKKK